jgi:hypothetical protein
MKGILLSLEQVSIMARRIQSVLEAWLHQRELLIRWQLPPINLFGETSGFLTGRFSA